MNKNTDTTVYRNTVGIKCGYSGGNQLLAWNTGLFLLEACSQLEKQVGSTYISSSIESFLDFSKPLILSLETSQEGTGRLQRASSPSFPTFDMRRKKEHMRLA